MPCQLVHISVFHVIGDRHYLPNLKYMAASKSKFAVIEFVLEKSVAVVCESWIEDIDQVKYSYWPKTNVAAKVRKCEIPDKQNWEKYPVRVFTFLDKTSSGYVKQKSGRSTPQQDNFQRCILTKLEAIQSKQDEMMSMLRMLLSAHSASGNDVLEDVLPKPVDDVDELEELSLRLSEDEEFKKKMLQFFIALCGQTCSITIRRIMAKVGTNLLWSQYSLRGRLKKKAFGNLSVCKLLIKASLRVHKKASEADVEEQIAEYLKHAPHKAGGAKFKNRTKD